mgnify:CR=1 FL=1
MTGELQKESKVLKIYGSPASSAGRCYWVLEECGVDYRACPVNMREGEHRQKWYLDINPAGKVPALEDGNLKLGESMAINNYLAMRYKPDLLPVEPSLAGKVHQWSYFAASDLQPPLLQIFIQKTFVPEVRRDQELIAKEWLKAQKPLEHLNKFLINREFLVDESFSLADLNVASVTHIARLVDLDLGNFQNVSRHLECMFARPAAKKWQSLVKGP